MAGIGFRALDQVGEIDDVAVRPRHDGVRRGAEIGDRSEVLLGIVAAGPLQQTIDENDARGHQQRVAIGIGFRHVADADIAVCAGVIFDDDRPSELLGQRTAHDPCDQIAASPGRKRHDDPDRTIRESSLRGTRQQRGQGGCDEAEQRPERSARSRPIKCRGGQHGVRPLCFRCALRPATATGRGLGRFSARVDYSFIFVTAQVGETAYARQRDFAMREGWRDRASMMLQPCFLAFGAIDRAAARRSASSAASERSERAGVERGTARCPHCGQSVH